MSSIDKLKLLAGLPISMSDFTCFIYPSTLKEIAELGIEKYFKFVNLCTIGKESIKNLVKEDIDPFDFIFLNSVYKEDFKNEIIEALKFFTHEDILLLPELESFLIGEFNDSRFLCKDNFKEFQEIILTQNFLNEEIKSTGENESAKRIREKLEKSRRTIKEIKDDSDEKIDFSDLIASLAINSSLNILEIWNISYYTFNDQFKRMRILEQYNTSLQSIMAGADPKKVKLEDWIKKVQ